MTTTPGWPRRRRSGRRLAAVTLTALALTSCAFPPKTSTGDIRVEAQAVDASSAVLNMWPAPGTARIEIRRDGRPVEAISLTDTMPVSYTDHLLWPSTLFAYEVRAYRESGGLIAEEQVSVTTPRLDGAFPRMYGASSFWNQPIPDNPKLDPGSAAMVSKAIVPFIAASNFVAGSNEWGKPLAYASPNSAVYAIGCTHYDCATRVSFRIPPYAVPSSGTDHHLVVIDPASNSELDMWLASHNPVTDTWSAGDRYLTDPAGWGAICKKGQRCGAAVAAGFAAFGGVVRPEEIAQGHIDHALFLTSPYTRKDYVACPATHTDATIGDPAAIPEGARVQLDPAINVDEQPWPRWLKILARALQVYGAYIGDTGQSLSLSAEATLDRGYDAWALAGVPPLASLSHLPWDHMRVLSLQRC
jgi:hypothetical protein